MKKPNYKIPFNEKHMMSYADVSEGTIRSEKYQGMYVPTEWRENKPFAGIVYVTGYGRGRSAARIHLKNAQNNETYSMGLDGFYEALQLYGMNGKTMRGTWYFRKQGANYSLYPYSEK